MVARDVAGAVEVAGFVVEEVGVAAVNPRRLDGHRAVDMDGEWFHHASAEEFVEVKMSLLAAAHGEGLAVAALMVPSTSMSATFSPARRWPTRGAKRR